MKSNVLATFTVLGLLVSLGHGCATEVGSDDATPIGVTNAAVEGDDGAIHAGCAEFLGDCRDGNTKQCAKYSERCDVRIGVIGDSLSDEYQGFVGLPGVQWTEQVQDDLRISLGSHEASPGVRGEPRNDGYGLNWARYAQAALTIQWNTPEIQDALAAGGITNPDPRWAALGPFDAQIHGLGAQIAAGQVDVALVWVGHNDLFIRTYIGYDLDGGQQAFHTALLTKIVTAAATLRAYASADPADIKAKVAIVGLAGAASALNPSLSAAAANAGIAYIDPFNTAVSAIVTEQAQTGSYLVGSTALKPFDIVFSPAFVATPKTASLTDLSPTGTGPCGYSPLAMGIACSTPAYAEPFRHYDAIHPNTIYMGTVGNQIITDVNTTFGFVMRTIPDAQLLDTAGL
jgi:hypothetical protein